jgi:hypothetical protein
MMVKVKYEGGLVDREIPEEYWEEPEQVCPICGEAVPNCFDCKDFELIDEDDRTPWARARGLCPLGVVYASNRACSLYRPRLDDTA